MTKFVGKQTDYREETEDEWALLINQLYTRYNTDYNTRICTCSDKNRKYKVKKNTTTGTIPHFDNHYPAPPNPMAI